MNLTSGQVAKKFQLSIRTIRYYDQIGLVSPSYVTDSGKRLYNEEQCMHLQKVVILKSLGLSLEDIQRLLTEQSISKLLAAHKSALEIQIEQLTESISQTTALINLHKLRGYLHWEELISLTAPQLEKTDWIAYFDEEESIKLHEVLPKLKNNSSSTTDWIQLLRRIENYVDSGISPDSPIARLMMEDLQQLSDSLFQGDQELMEKFWASRRSSEQSQTLGLLAVREDVISFIEAAYDASPLPSTKPQSH